MTSRLISRAVGYADLARQAGRVKRSTDDAVRENAQIHLAQRMGKLRSLPQKIGQILSMSDDEDRDALGLSLLRGFLRMLFHHGYIHADPHPGNYRFAIRPGGPKIILYDFGSVATITRDRRIALLKLIEISRAQAGNPYKPFMALGFNKLLLEPISGKLAALSRTLLEPFCQQGKYDLSTWQLSKGVDDILGTDRWNFRMSGPASLIFLMRAFRGLIYYLEQLNTRVSWYAGITPYLMEHQEVLGRFDASATPDQAGTFASLARHLKIRVTQNGATKVAITFPGTSVDNLRELMDDELMSRIAAQSIDIDAIVRDVRRSAYQPRLLFQLEETRLTKGVCVWLE